MSAAHPTNYWKLGLFVVSAIGLALGILAWLGVTSLRKDTFEAVTYFDESVQGLEVGSPVKVRGVKLGSVTRIAVAPDRRFIEVWCEVDRAQIRRLGIAPPAGPFVNTRPELRTQLSQQGIAGTLFVLVDIVDPKTHPAPKLSFPTPPNYVPSMSSTLKDLSEMARGALERMPDLETEAKAVLERARHGIDEADIAGVSSRAKRVLESADAVLTPLGPVAERLAQEDGLGATVADVGSTSRSLREELPGTLAAIRDMALAIRKAAIDLDHLTDATDTDLETIHETLLSLKRLADMLEHDPGSVIRGKATSPAPEGGGP